MWLSTPDVPDPGTKSNYPVRRAHRLRDERPSDSYNKCFTDLPSRRDRTPRNECRNHPKTSLNPKGLKSTLNLPQNQLSNEG